MQAVCVDAPFRTFGELHGRKDICDLRLCVGTEPIILGGVWILDVGEIQTSTH